MPLLRTKNCPVAVESAKVRETCCPAESWLTGKVVGEAVSGGKAVAARTGFVSGQDTINGDARDNTSSKV